MEQQHHHHHSQFNNSDSSTASTASGFAAYDPEQQDIKNMLRSHRFVGDCQPRTYIRSLEAYRDAIVVRADQEPRFVATLEYVKTKLQHQQQRRQNSRLHPYDDAPASTKWIGATVNRRPGDLDDGGGGGGGTASPATTRRPNRTASNASLDTLSWTIWTELPEGTQLGQHRFKVKTIRWRPNEIMIKVRLDDEPEPPPVPPPAATDLRPYDAAQFSLDLDALVDRGSQLAGQAWQLFCAGCVHFGEWLRTREYSWQRFAADAQYAGSVALLVLVLGVQLVAGVGRWSLMFAVEARKWWVVSVPVVQQLIDLAGKVIGAAFILVSMVWRDLVQALFYGGQRPPPPPPRPFQPYGRIGYGGDDRPRAQFKRRYRARAFDGNDERM